MSDMLESSARQLIDNPPTDGLSASGIRQRVAARQRRRTAIAGVGCAAVAVAGLGFIVSNRTEPGAASAPTETLPAVGAESAGPVAFVLPELPSELTFVLANEPSVRSEPSGYQTRLFGALSDPGDPAQMIRVEYARRDVIGLPCHSTASLNQPDGSVLAPTEQAWVDGSIPIADSTAFTAGTAEAAYCTSNTGLLEAGWFTDNVGVSIQAGSLVTPEQLMEFAQTVTETPTATPGNRPSVDLVSDPLPADLTLLVGEDVPFDQQITESSWVASVGGQDDSPNQLNVQTWQGVDEQGVFDRQSPIEAERITIRGHDGYRFVSEADENGVPVEVDIWWSEEPGVVVSVWSSNLYTAAELTSLVEQLQPADAANYEAFAEN